MARRHELPTSERIPTAAPFWYGWQHVARSRELDGSAFLTPPLFG